jgi:hypothetical protein
MKAPTLFDAVRAFLEPIMAEGCRVVDEWPPDMPVKIEFGPCTVEVKLRDIKALSDAYRHAFDQRGKRNDARWSRGLFGKRG